MNKGMTERWKQLSHQLPFPYQSVQYYHKIEEYYTEDQRHYHTLEHIRECLQELKKIKNKLTNPIIVELAIWFHDIIYDPHSKTNVEDSCQVALHFAKSQNIDQESCKILKQLIMTTKTHHCPKFDDGMYMVDIDLAILGKPLKRFWKYESQIESEYNFVPEQTYQEKRGEILETFLKKDNIYCTDYFRNKYEKKARQNIDTLLKKYEKNLI